MTIAWPSAVLKPSKITRHLAPRTTAGTTAASGFTQRVSVPAHAWVIEYDGIVVAGNEAIRTWDYIAAQLDGGSVPILVPLISEYNGGNIEGIVNATASAGSTSVVIYRPIEISAGYHFSIGEYLYRVASITSVSAPNYTLSIRPSLRQDVSSGVAASFISPICKCRLATDDEMRLDLDSARIGIGKVKFFEDVNV